MIHLVLLETLQIGMPYGISGRSRKKLLRDQTLDKPPKTQAVQPRSSDHFL